MSLTKVSFSMINGDWVNVLDFGAVGDGHHDDTQAIQDALDSDGYSPVYFPPGLYKVTGTGDACLTLSKNRNLYGCNRFTNIRADSAGTNTAILKVAITDNGGYLDVRGWQMRDFFMWHNGGGKDGLYVGGGFPMLNSHVSGCQIGSGTNGGYGLHDAISSHSEYSNCTFDYAFMECGDANVIRKCSFSGTGCAVTYDLAFGIRNNTVKDCTIVNRDGAVTILNGDNIRIENNQIELAIGYTPPNNQSAASAFIWLVGSVGRTVNNTVIRANNFGGGTNLNHSIYVSYGYRAVIRENNFIATAEEDIYLSAQSVCCIVGGDNCVTGSIADPRPSTLFKGSVYNNGNGNMGVRAYITPANGWTAPDIYKDEYGQVYFMGEWNSGATSGLMGTIQAGYWPIQTTVPVSTSAGTAYATLNPANGQIAAVSFPSNAAVYMPPFQSNNDI